MKRYVAYTLLALLGIVSIGVVAPRAYATGPLSAPDSNGAYQTCNINQFHDAVNDNNPGGTGAHWQIWFYCNWGGTKGNTSPFSGVYFHYQTQFNGTWQSGSTVARDSGSTANACAGTTFTTNESAQTFTGCMQLNSNGQTTDHMCVRCAQFNGTGTGTTPLDWTIGRYYYTGGVGQPEKAGRVMTVGTSGGMPAQPADWYTGGAAPPTPDATAPVPNCSRTLTDTSAMTGQFRSGAQPTTVQAVATQGVWNYGDTNTTTIATAYPYDRNHTYGALSTMPTDGWTATLTVTYTANSGHTFADTTTTKTAVCSLRVDFLNPDKTTPGSTGGSSGSGSGDINNPTSIDDCSPSGWGWLNPVSLVKGGFCVIKLGFIPSSATGTAITGMWTSITTKAPFSVLYEVVTFVPNELADFVAGINDTSPIPGVPAGYVSHMSGPSQSPICGTDNGSTDFNGHGTGLCNINGQYPWQYGGPFRVDGGSGHVTNGSVYLVRQICLFALGVLFFYACYRGIAEVLK